MESGIRSKLDVGSELCVVASFCTDRNKPSKTRVYFSVLIYIRTIEGTSFKVTHPQNRICDHVTSLIRKNSRFSAQTDTSWPNLASEWRNFYEIVVNEEIKKHLLFAK